MTDDERAKKLSDARGRYGKAFVTATHVKRTTPPSTRLREINQRSGVIQMPPLMKLRNI
jgi:hypothetical protein